MDKMYEEILKEYLSKRMKETRLERGITQAEMAEKLDIETRSYYNVEHGISLCKVPTFFHFLAFSLYPEKIVNEILQLMAETFDDAM